MAVRSVPLLARLVLYLTIAWLPECVEAQSDPPGARVTEDDLKTGIVLLVSNPAGAMVVANLLLFPEAQLEKERPEVWGDGTVLELGALPPEWRARFEALESDPRALPTDSLARYALPEVAPLYHERLSEAWRRSVRRHGG